MKFNKMIKRVIRFCKRNEEETHPHDSFITIRFHYEWNHDKKCHKFSGVYFFMMSPFERVGEYVIGNFETRKGEGAYRRSWHFRYSQGRKYFIRWSNKGFLAYDNEQL